MVSALVAPELFRRPSHSLPFSLCAATGFDIRLFWKVFVSQSKRRCLGAKEAKTSSGAQPPNKLRTADDRVALPTASA